MANERLSLVLDVKTAGEESLNRLSAGLEKVASIADRTGKSLNNAGGSNPFANFPGLVKSGLQDPIGTAESTVTSLLSSMGAGGAVAGGFAVAIAAIGAAAFAASRELGQYAEQISNTAERTGLNTTQVQEFAGAAKIAGVDIGGLTVAMKSLSTGLRDGSEEGKKQKLALNELGIQAEDALHRIRPVGDLIPEIFRKLGDLPAGLDRDFLAKTILGKGGLELIPLIGHLDELTAAVRRTGVVMGGEGIAAAAKYDDAFDILGLRIDAAKHKLGLWTAEALMASSNPLIMAILQGGGAEQKDAPLPSWVTKIQADAKAEAQAKLDQGTGEANQVIRSTRTRRTAQDLLKDAQAKLAITPEPTEGKYATAALADAAVKAYNTATAEVRKYEEAVKLAAKAEALHIAAIEKGATLRREGQSFLSFQGADGGTVFVTGTDQQTANGARRPPSLLRNGERDPNAPLDNGILATGMYAGGFVSSSEDRRTDGLNGIATGGLFDDPKYKQDEQIKIDGLKNELDFTSRIIQLRTGPGGELAAALQINSLRLDAAYKEFETTNDIVTLESTRTKLAYERSALAEQDAAREKAKIRDLAGGLFDSLFGGGAGISKFIENQLQSVARTVVQNAAGLGANSIAGLVPHANDPNSTFGQLLQGTPFGAKPEDLLKTSTDLNTAATTANTLALKSALSPSGGGGSASGSTGTILSGISSVGGKISASSDAGSGEAPEYDGAPPGENIGSGEGSGGGGMSLGGKLSLGAAAAGGAFAAFSDFKTGGVKNDVAGAGALLGSAAAITAMIPGGQIVALGLGIASAATSLVAGLLPDPKKVREAAITKELEQNKYIAPTALNISQDGSGNYTDFDAKGGLRSSPFRAVPSVSQAYTWWKGNTPYDVPGSVTSPFQQNQAPVVQHIYQAGAIQTMDAGSFHEFAQKNSMAIGESAATHLQDTEGRLHSAIRYAANG